MGRGERAAVLALAGMTLVAVMYVSLPSPATSHVAGGVGAAKSDAVWVVNAYLAANAVAAPLAARLAERIGHRRACLGCIGAFTLATALCGTADTLGGVIAWRVAQGLAGGVLVPLAQAALSDASGPGRQGPLVVFSSGVMIGPAFGPAVGGLLADEYSWRMMFLPGVPIGVLALAVCARWLPADPVGRTAHGRFDWVGAVLLVAGLACLEVVLVNGQQWDWFGSRTVVTLSAGAAVALLAAGVRCLRAADPVVRLGLLADRHFLACVALGSGATAAYVGGLSTITKLLLRLMGYASANVGELAAPATLALLLLVPVLAAAAGGAGGRLVPAAGLVILASGAAWLSAGNLLLSPDQVLWPRAVMVVGTALTISSVNAAVLRGVSDRYWADAAGVFNLFRNLGASLGITLSAVALDRRGQVHLAQLTEAHLGALNPVLGTWLQQAADRFLPGPAAGDPSTAHVLALKSLDNIRQQQAQGMAHFDALLLCAALAAALIPLVLLLNCGRGARIRG
jgi:MFS transporter, DHA2 family, multidrug resistance protein